MTVMTGGTGQRVKINCRDFICLGMWSVLVVQSEQHVIYRLRAGGDREAQANMEEINGERLP